MIKFSDELREFKTKFEYSSYKIMPKMEYYYGPYQKIKKHQCSEIAKKNSADDEKLSNTNVSLTNFFNP